MIADQIRALMTGSNSDVTVEVARLQEIAERVAQLETEAAGLRALLVRTLPDLKWAESAASSEWNASLDDPEIVEDIEAEIARGTPAPTDTVVRCSCGWQGPASSLQGYLRLASPACPACGALFITATPP